MPVRARARSVVVAGGSCPAFPTCGGDTSCFCTDTVEGTSFCALPLLICGNPSFFCTSSQECPQGWVCARTCCGQSEPVCNPPCGAEESTSAAFSAQNGVMSGPASRS